MQKSRVQTVKYLLSLFLIFQIQYLTALNRFKALLKDPECTTAIVANSSLLLLTHHDTHTYTNPT